MLEFLKILFGQKKKRINKSPKKSNAPTKAKASVHTVKCTHTASVDCGKCCTTTTLQSPAPASVDATVEEKKSVAVAVEAAPETVETTFETVEENAEREEPKEEVRPGAYSIKLVKEGTYVFQLLGEEDEVIITSGEYTLKRSCVSGIQSVKKNGATENIEDQTAEKVIKTPNPKYEVFSDEKNKLRFRLKAPNGYVILTSSAYNSKKACLKAIEKARVCSQTDQINDYTK